ncbi:MAG TPA: tetratricopeptide repeat protein [Candidatus Saccharimonadales bacterium]|nr:tetratricopeptide repeat protein [Candidatus Saccharimonadales bacterium]
MVAGQATYADIQAAFERGDHDEVLRLTDVILAGRPGDDAAHELRARALLALGRVDEAERHAADAVRLDPDEVRYRELLATVLAARGAHRDAAVEFGWLARNDPRQVAWAVAEAAERLDAAQEARGIEAARRAARLDPENVSAQLALARGLTRLGDARGALAAAQRAIELAPDELANREALADALWLTGREAAAFAEFRALLERVTGRDRSRVLAKTRSLYRQQAGALGRAVASVEPFFRLALRLGWIGLE